MYNLVVQSKMLNLLQEIQDTKQFLEHISIAHYNLSLSLRDNVSNEIILQIHKSKDIYQKINLIFGINKNNLQELNVMKDKLKVQAYIGKDIDQQNHLIYLNQRYLDYCKLYKIMDDFLLKYLDVGTKVHKNTKFKVSKCFY